MLQDCAESQCHAETAACVLLNHQLKGSCLHQYSCFGMQQMSVVVSGMEMQHATVSTPFFRVGKIKLRNGNLLLKPWTTPHSLCMAPATCLPACLPSVGCPHKNLRAPKLIVQKKPDSNCRAATTTQQQLRLLSSTHLAQLHLLAHSRQPRVQDGIQDARNREHTTHHRTCGRQELVPRLGQLPHHHLKQQDRTSRDISHAATLTIKYAH